MRLSIFFALALTACGGASSFDDTAKDASASGDLHEKTDLADTQDDAGLAADDAAPPVDLATGPDLLPSIEIVQSPIPFADSRKQEMATYSKNHYGDDTYLLAPKQIVLHFTATSTYQSAWNIFSQDVPNRGELPGTCAHYIIEKDGTIHQLVDESIRCRHAVGMDWIALGIEIVQETGTGASWADGQILNRPAQIDAALKLVKMLQVRYNISTDNVIGHAIANQSPYFKDLEGWTNDHTDWQGADVMTFRTRLDAL